MAGLPRRGSLGGLSKAAADGAYVASGTPTADAPGLGVYFPEAHGAHADGSTDDTVAVLAADAAAQANGGTVYFQAGKTYLCNGALIRAYTGTTSPKTKPVRWTSNGGGPAWDGTWPNSVDTSGCATLDLRYDGTDTLYPAKITTLGAGRLEVDHLALVSGGTDNLPFLLTTNTTVRIHDNFIGGNPANLGTACQQDAFILGGTANVAGAGNNAPFQGYGSEIHHNFFHRIRRAAYFRTFANGLEFSHNVVSLTCGSNLAGGACVELHGNIGGTGESIFGNRIHNNTFETGHYPYITKSDYAQANSFTDNGYYDPSATTIAYHHFSSINAKHNITRPAFWDSRGGLVALADMAGGALLDYNTVMDQVGTGGWVVDVPVSFGGGLTTRAFGAGGAPQIQFTKSVGDATAGACFDNYGRTWHYQGVGGDLKIDTGTGGSFLNLLAWQVRLFDQTGVQRASLLSGSSYKGALQSGAWATGSRPSAVTCGAGAMGYDTTLSKPIWSDGTVWRDAAGTAV